MHAHLDSCCVCMCVYVYTRVCVCVCVCVCVHVYVCAFNRSFVNACMCVIVPIYSTCICTNFSYYLWNSHALLVCTLVYIHGCRYRNNNII